MYRTNCYVDIGGQRIYLRLWFEGTLATDSCYQTRNTTKKQIMKRVLNVSLSSINRSLPFQTIKSLVYDQEGKFEESQLGANLLSFLMGNMQPAAACRANGKIRMQRKMTKRERKKDINNFQSLKE